VLNEGVPSIAALFEGAYDMACLVFAAAKQLEENLVLNLQPGYPCDVREIRRRGSGPLRLDTLCEMPSMTQTAEHRDKALLVGEPVAGSARESNDLIDLSSAFAAAAIVHWFAGRS
jgi:hypothetical protein